MMKSGLSLFMFFVLVLTLSINSRANQSQNLPASGDSVIHGEKGKREAGQKQWKKTMGNNPSQFKECGDDCPVDRVSWNEVQIFIN